VLSTHQGFETSEAPEYGKIETVILSSGRPADLPKLGGNPSSV